MNYVSIRYEVSEKILTLTFNRPEYLNAFTVDMSHELVDAFQRASDDDQVGAIVVTGKGRAFCAGMDLSVADNVFWLNEEMRPTLDDLRERADNDDIYHGVATLGGG